MEEPQPAMETGDVAYPLAVQYCGECSLPLEYCEFAGKQEKCRQWLEKNLPAMIEALDVQEGDQAQEEKKHQKRGGKGGNKEEAKAENPKVKAKQSKISLKTATRGKGKSVTLVKGLASFDIDLKAAAKFFSSKFACGSTVTAEDELSIQGDVKEKLFSVIPEKWPQCEEKCIVDEGGK